MKGLNQKRQQLRKRISEHGTGQTEDFEGLAMDLFRFQYQYNKIYKAFCDHLHRWPERVDGREDIPFLPISAFRHHLIRSGEWHPKVVFESSGTTSSSPARHAIRDPDWYHHCTDICFSDRYGSVEDRCFIALLPSYLERSNASLVYMMDRFIRRSKYDESGFYLHSYKDLMDSILDLKDRDVPTVLFGVSFALYDLAERYEEDLSGIDVMETGGFKGRGPDLLRSDLHDFLCDRWNIDTVHSEYGMTELFSQAYSDGGGRFYTSPLLDVKVFEINDPLSPEERPGRTGRLHLIDLGNVDTCCFIATEDIGRQMDEDAFTVEGRLDGSMLRGCNLMLGDIKKEPE